MDPPDELTGIFYAIQFDTDLPGRVDELVKAIAAGRMFGTLTTDAVAAAIDRLLDNGTSIVSRDVFAEQPRSEEELRAFLVQLRRRLRSQ